MAVPAYPNRGDGSICQIRFEIEDARASHLESLFDGPSQGPFSVPGASRQVAGEGGCGTSRCRILDHREFLREHPRTNVGVLPLGVVRKGVDVRDTCRRV